LDELRIECEKLRAEADLQRSDTEKHRDLRRIEADRQQALCEEQRIESARIRAENDSLRDEVASMKVAADENNNNRNVHDKGTAEIARLQALRDRDLVTHRLLNKQLLQLRADAASLDGLKEELKVSEKNYGILEATMKEKDYAVEVLVSELSTLKISITEHETVLEEMRTASSSDANMLDKLQSKINELLHQIQNLQRAKTAMAFPQVHLSDSELNILNDPISQTPVQTIACADDGVVVAKRARQDTSVQWTLKSRSLQYSEEMNQELVTEIHRRTGQWLYEIGDSDTAWHVMEFALGLMTNAKCTAATAPASVKVLRCSPKDLSNPATQSERWIMAALLVAREVLGKKELKLKASFMFVTSRADKSVEKTKGRVQMYLDEHK
jgi:hypothetical protein